MTGVSRVPCRRPRHGGARRRARAAQADDGQRQQGHRGGGGQFHIERQAGGLGALEQVADQAGAVIGDGGDGQAFHGLLQVQLHRGAAFHRGEQGLVLPFAADVDAGAQQRGGAIDALGQGALRAATARQVSMAGVSRRCRNCWKGCRP